MKTGWHNYAVMGVKKGCWDLGLCNTIALETMIVHCTILGSKVTSMRAKIAQYATQSGPDEAEFPSREYFLKMAKCGREIDS